MNQALLNRAIARATGESVDRIQRMGFALVSMTPLVARPSAPSGGRWPPRSEPTLWLSRLAARPAGVA